MNVSGAILSGLNLGGSILEGFGDLILDWDAEVNITIGTATGANRVIRWVDKKSGKSPQGNDTTTRPLYTASFHNSLPAVTFESDDFLFGARDTRMQGLTTVSMIMVGQNGAFGHVSGLTADRTTMTSNTSNQVAGIIANGANTSGSAAAGTETAPSIKILTFDGSQTGNSNRLKIYRNKTQLGLTYVGTIPATTENNANGRLGLGMSANASTIIPGNLMRCIVFRNIAFTQTEVDGVSDLLNTKYACY